MPRHQMRRAAFHNGKAIFGFHSEEAARGWAEAVNGSLAYDEAGAEAMGRLIVTLRAPKGYVLRAQVNLCQIPLQWQVVVDCTFDKG